MRLINSSDTDDAPNYTDSYSELRKLFLCNYLESKYLATLYYYCLIQPNVYHESFWSRKNSTWHNKDMALKKKKGAFFFERLWSQICPIRHGNRGISPYLFSTANLLATIHSLFSIADLIDHYIWLWEIPKLSLAFEPPKLNA